MVFRMSQIHKETQLNQALKSTSRMTQHVWPVSQHAALARPADTATLCHFQPGVVLGSLHLIQSYLQAPPSFTLFLTLFILGTQALAQCKLFSPACRGPEADHKSRWVCGYFIQATVAKHHRTALFSNPHKNKVALAQSDQENI